MANLKNTIKKCIACNNSTTPIQYKDTFISMSSVEGIPDMLYVDESTGDIYIWNGTTYITADVPTIPEARICLNDTAFAPLDLNNPTTAEVESYVTTNGINTDGTQVVYFVAGDGGSCDNPDYTWTINGAEVTLSNKRVFNTKTVYVDAGSGSDVTGRRGYREFPFKTIDAAIAVTQTGDLLKVFPGTYTQNTTIQNLINIDCEEGVTWTFTSNFFNNTPDWATDVTITWSFDVLKSTITPTAHNFGIKNSLGIFVLNATLLENIFHAANVAIKQRFINVKKLVNSYVVASSLSPVTDAVSQINLDYYERTLANTSSLILGAQMGNNAKLITHVKNLKSINSITGYGSTPTIGYYFGSDVGINKQYTTIIDNVTHDDPNIYVTPPGPLDIGLSWIGVSARSSSGKLVHLNSGGVRNGSTNIVEINNIKSTGHAVSLVYGTVDNTTTIVKIIGTFEKGIPVFTSDLHNTTNSKIILELDVECYTSMGVFISFFDSTSPWNNIPASNQIIVTGRIKTRYAGMSCISIGTGDNPLGNNTNGTILLKDLTLINDGTVSPIMCGVPENVQIQNVVTNSLIVDPNITEVGQSIIRNANYK